MEHKVPQSSAMGLMTLPSVRKAGSSWKFPMGLVTYPEIPRTSADKKILYLRLPSSLVRLLKAYSQASGKTLTKSTTEILRLGIESKLGGLPWDEEGIKKAALQDKVLAGGSASGLEGVLSRRQEALQKILGLARKLQPSELVEAGFGSNHDVVLFFACRVKGFTQAEVMRALGEKEVFAYSLLRELRLEKKLIKYGHGAEAVFILKPTKKPDQSPQPTKEAGNEPKPPRHRSPLEPRPGFHPRPKTGLNLFFESGTPSAPSPLQ